MIANKKLLTLTLSTILAASLLTGCGGGTAENTADQTQATAEAASATDYKGSTVMGKVTAVNGNEITLSIGGGPGGRKGGMKPGDSSDNTKPDDSSDNAKNDDSSDDINKRNGNKRPDFPSDKNDEKITSDKSNDNNTFDTQSDKNDNDNQTPPDMPSDDNGMKRGESKTLTITIDDESVLQDITLSDITEGTRLSVTFDDNGDIKTVSSAKDFGPNGKGERPDNGNDRKDKPNNNSDNNKNDSNTGNEASDEDKL